MIPVAKLHIEMAMVNPPKPTGIGVFVEGKMIAVVELDELKRVAAQLVAIEAERRT